MMMMMMVTGQRACGDVGSLFHSLRVSDDDDYDDDDDDDDGDDGNWSESL